MLTPSEVVDEARDLHPSFTEAKHPEKVLIRALSAWQQELLSKLQRVYPEELRLVETVSLPISPFEDGHTLPANTGVSEGTLYHNETDFPQTRFQILPEVQGGTGGFYWPSGFVRGGTLFLNGKEADWEGYDRIEVPYIPAPAAIDPAGDDTSSLPDQARSAARYHLAEFMAARHDGDDPVPPLDYFATRASGKEDEFLRAMQLKGSGTTGKIRDVRGRS